MKNAIISIIVLLAATAAVAQTNYYPNTTGTIVKSEYTYNYRNPMWFGGVEEPTEILLYNADSRYLDTKFAYKDGSEMDVDTELGLDFTDVYTDKSLTERQIADMINACFSSQQRVALRDKHMYYEVRIDTSTGKVADVYFRFDRSGPLMNIPVETYRSIELALKKNLSVTLTAEGRRRNYIQRFWQHKF
ncbi:MAG: DUF5043 domain-containing protein [Alistipes sp.]|nr:DUF5043 domain-containing protein [Alistipes sp.]